MNIKLVASDMDGTLLLDRYTRPKNFKEVFEELMKKNIKFVAASGRSYENLRRIFSDVHEDTIYVAENGALIMYKENELYKSVIDKEIVKEIVTVSYDVLSSGISLCTKDANYLDNELLSKVYKELDYEHIFVDSLLDIAQKEEVIKIGVYDYENSAINSYPIYSRFNDKVSIMISGENWLDITNKNISKGQAIGIIQEKFNINRSESMAFGDYLNDIDMMKEVKYSFAMKNAHKDLKKVCYGVTYEDCENNGVLNTINRLIFKRF